MKNIFFLICALPMMSLAQIGSIKTEQYKADFEKKQSIEVVANYTDTIQIPIQILKIGINEELFEMYPEIKELYMSQKK